MDVTYDQETSDTIIWRKESPHIWDDTTEKWYFSIIDVISVLSDSDHQSARKYWKVLKGRLIKEGNKTVTNCYQLKLKAEEGEPAW